MSVSKNQEIEELFGSRENRNFSFFDYHTERFKAYLSSVPEYIPPRFKEAVAKRIANQIGINILNSSMRASKKTQNSTLTNVKSSVRYGMKFYSGYAWLLKVTPDPIIGEINLGESEFAITNGEHSTFQTHVGDCLGIIIVDQGGEILTFHTYPIIFDQNPDWRNNPSRYIQVCEMYLHQIDLIWPGLTAKKIILNSQTLGERPEHNIFRQVLEEKYHPETMETYHEPNIEFDPKDNSVYSLIRDSSQFSDEYNDYILFPKREAKLN